MNTSLVRVHRDIASRIATITLERQDKRNALTGELLSELLTAVHSLHDDQRIKAVVLTGGPVCFSAGADFSLFETLDGEQDANRLRIVLNLGSRVCAALEALPQLTVAAVEGAAVGGGLSLAVSCDWRVMANDAWAYVPEAKLGVNYGWNTIPRLVALAGPARTKLLSILCRRHSAQELASWGIADMVCAPGEALQHAIELATEAAGVPALSAGVIKQTVNAYSRALLAASTHGDAEHMILCARDPEGQISRAKMVAGVARRV